MSVWKIKDNSKDGKLGGLRLKYDALPDEPVPMDFLSKSRHLIGRIGDELGISILSISYALE